MPGIVKMLDMEQIKKQSPSTYKVHSLVNICLRLWKMSWNQTITWQRKANPGLSTGVVLCQQALGRGQSKKISLEKVSPQTSLEKSNPRVSYENLETVAKSRTKANFIFSHWLGANLAQMLGLNVPGRLSVLGMLATVTRHEEGKRESASKGLKDRSGLWRGNSYSSWCIFLLLSIRLKQILCRVRVWEMKVEVWEEAQAS